MAPGSRPGATPAPESEPRGRWSSRYTSPLPSVDSRRAGAPAWLMHVRPRRPLLNAPTGGSRYTSTQRAPPAGTASLRRYSFVLIETYSAPPQSAKPVTFCVRRVGDPGAAATNSGVGSNTRLCVAFDHVPRTIPVGATPAYTDHTPPDS